MLVPARFLFDPNGFDPGEGQGHLRTRLFILFEENPTRRLMAVVLRRVAGAYSLEVRTRVDSNAQVDTGFFPITIFISSKKPDLLTPSAFGSITTLSVPK